MRRKALPELTGTVCATRQGSSHKIVAGAAASGAAVTPGEDSKEINSAMCFFSYISGVPDCWEDLPA